MEHKNIIWKSIKNLKDEYNVKDMLKSINKNSGFNWVIENKYCVIDEYLEIFQDKFAIEELNSLNDFFEQMQDEIPDIANGNINIYNIDVSDYVFTKMKYLMENHSEYFETFEPKKTEIYDVLRAAEYHMIEDVLFEFHNEFSNRLEKSLDYKLVQQNQMNM